MQYGELVVDIRIMRSMQGRGVECQCTTYTFQETDLQARVDLIELERGP